MSRANFCELVAALIPFMSPEINSVREPVPVDKRIAIAVYKLASCCEDRVVANHFGVHKSTVQKFVYLFCSTVKRHLAKKFISLPSSEEAALIARRFSEKCHIPQICGAIDGTHIPITAPGKGYRHFINRKMGASYNMQAVVDDHGL